MCARTAEEASTAAAAATDAVVVYASLNQVLRLICDDNCMQAVSVAAAVRSNYAVNLFWLRNSSNTLPNDNFISSWHFSAEVEAEAEVVQLQHELEADITISISMWP